MFHPRVTTINDEEVLVHDDQMIGCKEHLINEHRILFMSGAIAGDFEIHNNLMALDSLSHDPIRIVITSVGGDLDATFLLYDTIKLIKSPVETVGRYCASAAALLLASGSKRYLFPHAKVMLHLQSTFFKKDSEIPSQEIEILQKEDKKYKEKMVDILQDCGVKKSRQAILTDIDRSFWLEPEEACQYGLADEIITPQIWASMIGGI